MNILKMEFRAAVIVAVLVSAIVLAGELVSGFLAATFTPVAKTVSDRKNGVTVYSAAQAFLGEATFFAFDDVSIPFRQNLYFQMHAARKHSSNPVLPKGKKGEPDDYRAQFYGSVIRHEGKFKMWYIAGADEAVGALSTVASLYGFRPAYAESDDGIHWTKPNLGLVDFHGDRNNNLVLIEPRIWGHHLIVIYEPDDSDPSRRFKMMLLSHWGENDSRSKGSTSVPFYSHDGLRWRSAVKVNEARITPPNYLLPASDLALPAEHFEQAGLFKWKGVYHLAGQQFSPHLWMPNGEPCGRVMTIFRSPDLIRWSQTKTFSFVRAGYKSTPEGHGEEVHEPASVWHRGNVLLGLYGIWHGAARWEDRRMDLGLLISNDGVHFREPIPDFALIPRGEQGSWDAGGLLSGQAFENVGDQTYIWYGTWNLSLGDLSSSVDRIRQAGGQVGLATLRQDGFGFLAPKEPSKLAAFITCPLTVRGPAKITINAQGLSQDAWLQVELVDEAERPLPGSYGQSSVPLQQPGVKTEVLWRGQIDLGKLQDPFRIKVSLEGKDRQSIKFYALYVSSK